MPDALLSLVLLVPWINKMKLMLISLLIHCSGSRRGSIINPPDGKPALCDHRGSVHNLQLDIMDGLVQVKLPDGNWNKDAVEEEEDNDEIVLVKDQLKDKSKWIPEAAEEGDSNVRVET